MDKPDKERYMLEGAIGYSAYLLEQLQKGKIKTIEEATQKISQDAIKASAALMCHLEKALQMAGMTSRFLNDADPQVIEKDT